MVPLLAVNGSFWRKSHMYDKDPAKQNVANPELSYLGLSSDP